jgi:hypothetical protein
MSLNTGDEWIIQVNKYRFYDYYYEIKDECLIHVNDSNIPDTYHKPDSHTCMLVKRVFDNYLLSSEICDYYKIIEALRFCNELIANNNDIFELLNPSTINILFTQINNYGILLSELETGGLMIRNILEYINSLKLKSTLLENLIYIVHKNLSNMSMTSRANSYESRSLSIGSDLSNKAPMDLLTTSIADSITGKVTHSNIYNYIVHWVFTKYKKRMFWITTEFHTGCIKLMRFNNILTEDNCSLISQTLKRFVRPDLLISKLTHQWNIEFELVESLNMLKNKIITKDQHWIKPAIRQYQQIVPISPGTGNKLTLVLIDGANWFYNARCGSGSPSTDKSKLLPDEIGKIGTPQWEDSIIKRIHIHTHHKLAYDITETFGKNLRIIVVFNERHSGFISQINPDLHKYIVYTPRGVSDDAMILYLWLTNPGSFLLSNDLYNDWANALSGNHYLMGLWNQWVSCMKISK